MGVGVSGGGVVLRKASMSSVRVLISSTSASIADL